MSVHRSRTFSCAVNSFESWNINPFSSCFTNSCKLKTEISIWSNIESGPENKAVEQNGATLCTHHWKCIAQTGRQQPNMSTTFIGRSRPLEDLCRQTPRSAEPGVKITPMQHRTLELRTPFMWNALIYLYVFSITQINCMANDKMLTFRAVHLPSSRG